MGRAPGTPTTNRRPPAIPPAETSRPDKRRIDDLASPREYAKRGRQVMSTVIVKRLPRRAAPEIPTGELAVNPPPEIPQATNARWQQALMMLPMLAGTVATALLFAGRSGGTYSYIVGGVFG